MALSYLLKRIIRREDINPPFFIFIIYNYD